MPNVTIIEQLLKFSPAICLTNDLAKSCKLNSTNTWEMSLDIISENILFNEHLVFPMEILSYLFYFLLLN